MTCLLLLLLSCGSPAPTLLTATHMSLAIADVYTTQQAAKLPGWREINPLERPFQSHGPAIAYASNITGVMITSAVAYKMRTSHTWLRKVWWVPQVVLIGASGWGLHTTLEIK